MMVDLARSGGSRCTAGEVSRKRCSESKSKEENEKEEKSEKEERREKEVAERREESRGSSTTLRRGDLQLDGSQGSPVVCQRGKQGGRR